MVYDAFLAAAVAKDLGRLLGGRVLLGLDPLWGTDLLLTFGPRRDPAWLVLGGQPLPAVYGLPGDWPATASPTSDDAAALRDLAASFPPEPGLEPFCRLARARLAGRAVTRVGAYPWERVVELAFGPREGLRGDRESAFLVHEAAPKPARFVLLGGDRKVVAAWPAPGAPGTPAATVQARVAHDEIYSPPPSSRTPSPAELAADRRAFAAALDAARLARAAETWNARPGWPGRAGPGDRDLARLVLEVAPSLGPVLAREVTRRAATRPGSLGAAPGEAAGEAPAAKSTGAEARVEPDVGSLHEEFRRLISSYPGGPFAPHLYVRGTLAPEPEEVSALPVTPPQGLAPVPMPSASQAVAFWHESARVRIVRDNLAAGLRRDLRKALARASRKVERQEDDLRRTGEAADLRLKGELLLANLHLLAPGQKRVTLTDYQGRPVNIELDPRLSPSANAQRYFARYRKAQRSAAHENVREKAALELAWLESLAFDLDRVGSPDRAPAPPPADTLLAAVGREIGRLASQVADLLALDRALAEAVRPLQAGGRTPAGRAGPPAAARDRVRTGPLRSERTLRYLTEDNLVVLAGRSARQNESLSLKTARPHDLWFHARGCPGSHVVLRLPEAGGAPETFQRSVLQAAALAAHLSAARGGGKVAVDYTEARHLRRPKGAPPGLVLYDPHETILVDTDRTPLPRRVTAGDEATDEG